MLYNYSIVGMKIGDPLLCTKIQNVNTADCKRERARDEED